MAELARDRYILRSTHTICAVAAGCLYFYTAFWDGNTVSLDGNRVSHDANTVSWDDNTAKNSPQK